VTVGDTLEGHQERGGGGVVNYRTAYGEVENTGNGGVFLSKSPDLVSRKKYRKKGQKGDLGKENKGRPLGASHWGDREKPCC